MMNRGRSVWLALAVVFALNILLFLFKPVLGTGAYNFLNRMLQATEVLIVLYKLWTWLLAKFVVRDASNTINKRRSIAKAAGVTIVAVAIVIVAERMVHTFPLTTQAEADLRMSQDVKNILGEPVREGWFMSFNSESSNGNGSANLSIPLEGSKAKGHLYATGIEEGGTWRIKDLYLTVDGSDRTVQISH